MVRQTRKRNADDGLAKQGANAGRIIIQGARSYPRLKQMEEALQRSESILHSFFDSPGVRREILVHIPRGRGKHGRRGRRSVVPFYTAAA